MEKQKYLQYLLGEAWQYRRNGDYEKAGELVKKAHSEVETDDYTNLGRIYHIYMQFESDQKNYIEAYEYCQRSLRYYIQSGNEDRIAHSKRHMAALLVNLNDLEKAVATYKNVIHDYENNSSSSLIDKANAWRGYAIALENIGEIDESIAAWSSAKEYYRSIGLVDGEGEAQEKITELKSRMYKADCIFCRVAHGESPSWKVYENASIYAFLDINPVSRYHTLVIPKKHYVNIFDIPDAELKEIIAAVGKLARLYQQKLGIQDLQIVNSSGAEAQQDVFHIHFHIVPRQIGDGQDIQWKTHKEWREDFNDMLEKLN